MRANTSSKENDKTQATEIRISKEINTQTYLCKVRTCEQAQSEGESSIYTQRDRHKFRQSCARQEKPVERADIWRVGRQSALRNISLALIMNRLFTWIQLHRGWSGIDSPKGGRLTWMPCTIVLQQFWVRRGNAKNAVGAARIEVAVAGATLMDADVVCCGF